MTAPPEMPDDHVTDPQSSLLPSADLSIRVRPAQFARMVGVSKQTVSCWIRDGKVTLGPDGRLNPARACDEVLRHSDPGRLRAKMLKPMVDDVVALRRQLDLQASELALLRDRVAFLEDSARETDEAEELLFGLIAARWDALRTVSPGDIRAALQNLLDIALLRIGGYFDDADRMEEELEQLLTAMPGIADPGNEGGAGGAPITGETNP